ncbi:hypothetical protein [Brevibacillus centrosporus]|uniref:hypothetical protein n=1 Tax=Brevibacillus centrosporus TaxID=54910 RepID=UPI002E1A8AB1|nr:hypothetical protein [Brevibacillus centrosporus]
MARTEVIKFRDFMDGTWSEPKKKNKAMELLKSVDLIPITLVPLAASALGFPVGAFAAESVTASATQVVAGTTLQILAHALDPITQILVAVSLPVASIVMIGGCFFFMFGNSEKAWSTIQNAGLGYILIQISPLFIKVLEQIGKSI